jgi:hypothetical protein
LWFGCSLSLSLSLSPCFGVAVLCVLILVFAAREIAEAP